MESPQRRRQRQGIVPPADAAALTEEIKTKLLAVTDPAKGRTARTSYHLLEALQASTLVEARLRMARAGSWGLEPVEIGA